MKNAIFSSANKGLHTPPYSSHTFPETLPTVDRRSNYTLSTSDAPLLVETSIAFGNQQSALRNNKRPSRTTIGSFFRRVASLLFFALIPMLGWGASSQAIPANPSYKDISEAVDDQGEYLYTCSSANIKANSNATSSWNGWYSSQSSFKEYEKDGSATCMGSKTSIPNLKYDKVYFYVTACDSFQIQAWGNGDDRTVNYSYQADGGTLTSGSFVATSNTDCAHSDLITLDKSKKYTIIVWNSKSEEIGVTYMLFKVAAGPVEEVCPEGLTISGPTKVKEETPFELNSALGKGNGELSYQWYKDGTAISGATSDKLTISSCTLSDAGTYTCQVSKDACPTATSNELTVEVEESTCPKTGERFKAEVLKACTCSVTSKTEYPVEPQYISVDNGSIGLYCIGSSTKAIIIKTTNNELQLNLGTGDVTIHAILDCALAVGDVISWTGNNGSNDYQLYITPTNAAKPSESSLKTTSNEYTVTATDGLAGKEEFYLWRTGSTTNIKTISVTRPALDAETPNFTTQPVSAEYSKGEIIAALTAEATVTDEGTITYEWFQKGESEDVSVGTKSTSYTPAVAGTYYCVATNTLADHNPASTKSDEATITINMPTFKVRYLPGEVEDTPGSVDVKEEDEYTVAACTYTPPTGKTFRHWTVEGLEGVTTAVPDQTFTMPDNNVTLTAYYDVQHTVKFFDGANQRGENVLVWNGEKLKEEDYKSREAQTLATFDKWYSNAECTTPAVMTDPITADANFYGKWNKVYADDVDFEAAAGGDKPTILTFLSDANYALASTSSIDWSKDITWDDNTSSNNGSYLGLKIKLSSTTIDFNVHADKLVVFKAGILVDSKSEMYQNEVKVAENMVGGSKNSGEDNFKIHYFYSEDEAHYQFKTTANDAQVIKAISFTDPYKVTFTNGGEIEPMTFKGEALILPDATGEGEFQGWFDAETGGKPIGKAGDSYIPTADIELFAQFSILSTDNSLKTLKYGETPITIVPEQLDYFVELPYKTAIPASVTYEANSEVATPVGEQTADVESGVASFTVTSESGVPANYTVTFTVAPKDGICITKTATTGSKNQTITGVYGDTGAENMVNIASDKKLGGSGQWIGVALVSGQKFAEGDIINVHTTKAGSQGKIAIYSNTGKTATKIADLTSGFGVLGDNKFALPAGVEAYDKLYICRTDANDWNGYVDFVDVYRSMNPILKSLTVAGVEATIDEANKTISVKLVNGTDPAMAELVPTIIANDDAEHKASAALAGTLAYNTPINYVVTDKDGDQTTYVLTATEGATPAAEPVITVQPVGHDYYDTELIQPLTVVATISDGGTLSYQWYFEGVMIPEATAASYTPDQAGNYYVVVTNTLGDETASVTSETATITISHLYTFASWDGTSTTFTKEGEWTIYPYNKDNKWLIEDVKFAANQVISAADANKKANIFNDQYFVIKFEKDMKNIVIANYYSGSDRYINGLYSVVLGDKSASKKGTATDIISNYEITYTGRSTNADKVTTTTINGHFESGVYYAFKMNGSGNAIFDIFATPATVVDEFAGLTAGTIDGVAMTDAQLAELNGDTHTLTLAESVIFAPAVEFTYKHTQTFDDEFVKTVLEATENGEPAEVDDNFEVSKTFETTTYKVVCPIDRTPAMSLSPETMDLSFALSVATKKSAQVTLIGLNLTDGTYSFGEMPTGLTINPASFTVANGQVNETFTVEFAATDRVATATKEIIFSDGTTSKTLTVTYGAMLEYTLQDVTESYVWDWTATSYQSSEMSVTNEVLANIAGITNDASFKSDEIMFTGNWGSRNQDGGCMQATEIKMNFAVPGSIVLYYRGTGNSAPATISVNGVQVGHTDGSNEFIATAVAYVHGETTITLAGASASDKVRVQKITFTAAEVLRDNLTVGHMYTTCKADNMLKVWGAGMYEPESFDGFYVDFVEAQEIKAGYGYLFVAEAPVVYTVYGENHEDAAVADAPNGMQGTLTDITLPEGNNYCGVKNNHLQYFGAGNQMTAEHAYIVIDKIGVDQTPAPAAARRLRVGPDRAMPTGNDNVTFNESEENMKFIQNNHFFILRDAKLYNANGIRVR